MLFHRFQNVGSKTPNKRPPGDKAMNFQKEKEKKSDDNKWNLLINKHVYSLLYLYNFNGINLCIPSTC